MFGLKSKKKIKNTDALEDVTRGNMQFNIHTMRDDIDAVASGSSQGDRDPLPVQPRITKPAAPVPKPIPVAPIKSPLESPSGKSLDANPAPASSSSKEGVPIESSDNPFFANGAKLNHPQSAPQEITRPQKIQEPRKATSPGNLPKTPNPFEQQSAQALDRKAQAKEPVQKVSSKISLEAYDQKAGKKRTSIESELEMIGQKAHDRSKPSADTSNKLQEDFFGRNNDAAQKSSNPHAQDPASPGIKKVLFVLFMIILCIGLIASGLYGWYWWSTKKIPNIGDISRIDDLQNQIGDTVGGILGNDIKPYAIDFPNYIELSSDESAAAEFKTKIAEISLNMPSQEISTPISFLVTDISGSPLTFNAFANLVGLTIPPEVFRAAGDTFEVYAIKENDNVLFGLAIDIKDVPAMRVALLTSEASLAQALEPLYNGIPYDKGTAFADNVYGEYAIRYTNLLEDESLSVDYTIGDRIYIGTSRESHRAILERYGAPGDQAVNPAP